MREYLLTVFVVSAAAAICGELTYRTGELGYRLAAGILVAYVTLAPVPRLIESFNIEDYMPSEDAKLSDSEAYEVAKDAFCTGIENAVCDKFSISGEDISVSVKGFDLAKMRCEKISVFLSGKGVFRDFEEIKRFVGGLGYGECALEAEL